MAQQTQLDGRGQPVTIAPGGYTLEAPGWRGSVIEMTVAERATRSDRGLYEERLQTALAGADIVTTRVFQLAVTTPPGATPATPTRAGRAVVTRDGEPAVVLSVPHLRANADYAVLYTDEAGVSRWLLPEPASAGPAAATRGGGGAVVFHLPRDGAPSPPDTAGPTRGPIAAFGRRLVRVLAWVTDDIIGGGALAVATRWERAKRAEGLHPLPWTDAARPVDWSQFDGQRGLLMVHGTFSSVAGTYGALYSPLQQLLTERYGQRIIAFNHPSLHQLPSQNVDRLIELVPPDSTLELDLICHSRGGLVSRELIRRVQGPLPGNRRIAIRKAVFVAAPHAGTILTDGDHLIDMLDRYTNLLTVLPDDAFTLIIEGILMLVKLTAHGVLKALPGLQSMLPSGSYLQSLNAAGPAPSTEFYAAAANFQPTAPSLLERFGRRATDRLVDRVFGEENDGVVPTRGCYEAVAGAPGFPIPASHRLVFSETDLVHHCNYFLNDQFVAALGSWLS